MDPVIDGAASTPSVAQCPQCAATATAVASLTPHFVSLRCTQCGEVWLLRERRKSLRHGAREHHPSAIVRSSHSDDLRG